MSLLPAGLSTRLRSHDVVITPPLFAIAFGVAGLSGTWRTSGEHWAAIVGDGLSVDRVVNEIRRRDH